MSQVEKLRDVLGDMRPHRSDELVALVYGASRLVLARLAARVNDLKQRLPEGQTIKGWHDKENAALYWYQIVAVAPPVQRGLFDGTVSESA